VELILDAKQAHSEAMSLPISAVAQSLVELLGASTVATVGGVKETRAVQQWIERSREPQRPHVLRFALQIALMISTSASADLARAWFSGANPYLDDRVPLFVLRDGTLEEVQGLLMVAARAFAARDGEKPEAFQP
jgi:hypothetical protein